MPWSTTLAIFGRMLKCGKFASTFTVTISVQCRKRSKHRSPNYRGAVNSNTGAAFEMDRQLPPREVEFQGTISQFIFFSMKIHLFYIHFFHQCFIFSLDFSVFHSIFHFFTRFFIFSLVFCILFNCFFIFFTRLFIFFTFVRESWVKKKWKRHERIVKKWRIFPYAASAHFSNLKFTQTFCYKGALGSQERPNRDGWTPSYGWAEVPPMELWDPEPWHFLPEPSAGFSKGREPKYRWTNSSFLACMYNIVNGKCFQHLTFFMYIPKSSQHPRLHKNFVRNYESRSGKLRFRKRN